ncbi:NUDIX hydrolase [Streptococcus caprae]|uniref:NUDIX hydrolase n=1 Tax=Streptococcus caprae TaxID=1640501 RepID=A0ABV8CVZ5_9STRE
MDFRTKVDNISFAVRVSGLMIRDKTLYLVKSPKSEYYLLGGAVAVGETTEQAVKRELAEEIGVAVTVERLAFVVENHFTLNDVMHHQIEFLYLVTPLSEPNPVVMEGGTNRTCEWVAINDLDEINLNPSFLKTALKNWTGQLQHIFNREEN